MKRHSSWASAFQWNLLIGLALLLLGGCQKKATAVLPTSSHTYQTKHVVILMIDGVRFSDTWGDSTHALIPNMARQMAPQGVFHPEFYNQGKTLTNPGHVAVTTGHYQNLKNNGTEIPAYPSLFHYYRLHTRAPATQTWIITSKDKLEILAKTESTDSAAQFPPSTNSGNNGLGTSYREDAVTVRKAKEIMGQHHPKLVLINLKEPDSQGHAGNWEGYLKAIQQSDQYAYDLWQWLQQDSVYKGTTSLLITNDHGRHTGKRFNEHGDDCEGCRHISLLMLGPDVKAGFRPTKARSQVDLAATVAELLHFPIPKRDGEPMLELLNKKAKPE
ncbi:sulfatase [Nibribacter ruber]|uniref:Sulfatase n=1 Tax=Nibribacter ruber TaxID=2698458 RepID=A0A6P1P421_9BACT|nr:alkaline phosphatase family protein [Nibribacter ruber]QHL89086.1 sulfatase [Nibribacter ruber]